LRSTARIAKVRREPSQSPTSKILNRNTQMRNVAIYRPKRLTKKRGRMREKNQAMLLPKRKKTKKRSQSNQANHLRQVQLLPRVSIR